MPSQVPIRVLIADDSPTALRSVCDYLEFSGGFSVVGTASDGVNAVQLAAHHAPDLALLDFRMPRLNGLQAARELRRAHPGLRVIIYSEINGPPKAVFRTACFRKSAACSQARSSEDFGSMELSAAKLRRVPPHAVTVHVNGMRVNQVRSVWKVRCPVQVCRFCS
jgi:DNA-binding NarL/FixJ family response regulator